MFNLIFGIVKSEGLFDQFRRECLADVDTKPAYQNLQHRVETSVRSFLDDQNWSSQMNKNQFRERLRKLITEYVILIPTRMKIYIKDLLISCIYCLKTNIKTVRTYLTSDLSYKYL